MALIKFPWPSSTHLTVFDFWMPSGNVYTDKNEFASPLHQRVYQYIRRYDAGVDLDTFSYEGRVEGTQDDYVNLLLQ